MKLYKQELVRLFLVSEKEKNGKYALKKFSGNLKDFNEAIDIDSTHMMELTFTLFDDECEDECYYFCCEVTDDVQLYKNGRLCLDLGCNDWLVVRNIVDKIDADRRACRFFLLGNADRTACRWVVAVPAGTVYTDEPPDNKDSNR